MIFQNGYLAGKFINLGRLSIVNNPDLPAVSE
jgi:hypothetical protein